MNYPFYNMNGNRKESIQNHAAKISDEIYTLKRLVSGFDGFHGRNGYDQKHREDLWKEKDGILKNLDQLEKYFDDIVSGKSYNLQG